MPRLNFVSWSATTKNSDKFFLVCGLNPQIFQYIPFRPLVSADVPFCSILIFKLPGNLSFHSPTQP